MNRSTAAVPPAAPAPAAVATRAHIVRIRRDGRIQAFQLRVSPGGPGQTRSFGVGRHGGEREALDAALDAAREHGLSVGAGRGGSPAGRPNSRSRTPAPGIRFEWTVYALNTVLYVVATWNERDGRPRASRYSVERHGLAGALDLAIAARTSCGAPQPDRAALLRALRKAHRDPASGVASVREVGSRAKAKPEPKSASRRVRHERGAKLAARTSTARATPRKNAATKATKATKAARNAKTARTVKAAKRTAKGSAAATAAKAAPSRR